MALGLPAACSGPLTLLCWSSVHSQPYALCKTAKCNYVSIAYGISASVHSAVSEQSRAAGEEQQTAKHRGQPHRRGKPNRHITVAFDGRSDALLELRRSRSEGRLVWNGEKLCSRGEVRAAGERGRGAAGEGSCCMGSRDGHSAAD